MLAVVSLACFLQATSHDERCSLRASATRSSHTALLAGASGGGRGSPPLPHHQAQLGARPCRPQARGSCLGHQGTWSEQGRAVLVPEHSFLCEGESRACGVRYAWGETVLGINHAEEGYNVKSFGKDITNWLWLAAIPVCVLPPSNEFNVFMVIPWRMESGNHLCLFSNESEDWSRFWGHIDRPIHFPGRILFIAFVLGQRVYRIVLPVPSLDTCRPICQFKSGLPEERRPERM